MAKGLLKGQRDHIVILITNWFASFSFHINETNNSWDRAISKFDLAKPKFKVLGEVKGQGHIVEPESNLCNSFLFHVPRQWDKPFLRYGQ